MPVVVVGHHVVIGYIGDETTGAEILSDVAECRKIGWRDAVRDLIEEEGRSDEVAVAAFLAGQIRFVQIPELIDRALGQVPARPLDDIETCVEVDAETRRLVAGWVPAGSTA